MSRAMDVLPVHLTSVCGMLEREETQIILNVVPFSTRKSCGIQNDVHSGIAVSVHALANGSIQPILFRDTDLYITT